MKIMTKAAVAGCALLSSLAITQASAASWKNCTGVDDFKSSARLVNATTARVSVSGHGFAAIKNSLLTVTKRRSKWRGEWQAANGKILVVLTEGGKKMSFRIGGYNLLMRCQ